jgi:murein tripeptide amidase MpaA
LQELQTDRYYKYDELTAYVKSAAQSHPQLASIDSMGQSWEGRDVWVLTLTNRETGCPDEKPAIYIDGNIHAGEVTGSMVCLYTIDYLLRSFGCDEETTWLLNNRTFYIAPRVNPDGAELYLTTPYMLRSSVRPYPDALVEGLPGLHPEDVNDDGWILLMRLRDDARGE